VTLSVIVPVYNEESRVTEALTKLLNCEFVDEVVVVDDGSTDKSRELIEKFALKSNKIIVLIHEKNQGKGQAIRSALKECSKELIAIHDADLEYDPSEIAELQKPILQGVADVVYGSRFIGSKPKRALLFWHSIGNKILTTFSNLVSNINLSDMETCQKVFKNSLISRIKLRESRFGIEPELTIKFARAGARIFEIGISYQGRSYSDGKKIGWKDGFSAIYCILKYAIVPKRFWLS
jgi:glycosyltransferase involved in cell wall biosynthesis